MMAADTVIADTAHLRLLPHEAYHQTRSVNVLNGGIERRFDALEHACIDNPAFKAILTNFGAICTSTEGHPLWNIKLHPYRIIASEKEEGEPAPEGIHRDGVDYIVSLLIRRVNVIGGVSYLADSDRKIIVSTELAQPGDFIVSDDRRTYHGVSSISPENNNKSLSYRDVLVIAFEKC